MPASPPPEEELLDVLDESGAPTGVRKPRAEVHRDGDWHRVFHLWIVTPENHVLLQRRAPTKEIGPGKLDVTVGGHLQAGETWAEGLREAEEEIGVAPSLLDLERVGTFRAVCRFGELVDREITEAFALRSDRPLRDYAPNPAEVDVLYEVPLARAVALWRDGRPVAVAGWDAQGRTNDALLHEGDLIDEGREDTLGELLAVAAWAGVELP